MTRVPIFVFLMLLLVLQGWAQQSFINDSGDGVFVIVVETDQVDFVGWDNNPHGIVDYLTDAAEPVQYIAPKGLLKYSDARERVVAGAFWTKQSSGLPVFAVSVKDQVGSYSLDKSLIRYDDAAVPVTVGPSFIDLHDVKLSSVLDLDYWSRLTPVMLRRRPDRPQRFIRMVDGEPPRELPLEKSLYWGKGGTDVTSIKMVVRDGVLRFLIATETRTAPGTAFSLVWFSNRTSEQERQIMEIEIFHAGAPHGVFMLLDNNVTLLIGEAYFGGYGVEGRIELDKLPVENEHFLAEQASMDVYSSLIDRGVFEQFPLGTILLREISHQE